MEYACLSLTCHSASPAGMNPCLNQCLQLWSDTAQTPPDCHYCQPLCQECQICPPLAVQPTKKRKERERGGGGRRREIRERMEQIN